MTSRVECPSRSPLRLRLRASDIDVIPTASNGLTQSVVAVAASQRPPSAVLRNSSQQHARRASRTAVHGRDAAHCCGPRTATTAARRTHAATLRGLVQQVGVQRPNVHAASSTAAAGDETIVHVRCAPWCNENTCDSDCYDCQDTDGCPRPSPPWPPPLPNDPPAPPIPPPPPCTQGDQYGLSCMQSRCCEDPRHTCPQERSSRQPLRLRAV